MLRKISNVLEDCKSVHGEREVLVVYAPMVKSQSLAIPIEDWLILNNREQRTGDGMMPSRCTRGFDREIAVRCGVFIGRYRAAWLCW